MWSSVAEALSKGTSIQVENHSYITGQVPVMEQAEQADSNEYRDAQDVIED